MISVESLSRYYGEIAAIDQLSFTVKANTVVGFLGRNGAGKSTTLKILAGLLEPSDGSVHIDDHRLQTTDDLFRKKIGYLSEEPPLYREMTVTDYLYFLGRLRGMSKIELDARIPALLDLCQLSDRANWVIDALSLGYRKRVGIAQAIIHEPSLIILDEPTSGLDPQQIKGMRELIRSLSAKATVLLSSHHLSEVSETCDQLLILNDGKLVASGTPEELSTQAQSAHLLKLTLIGKEANIKAHIDSFEGALLEDISVDDLVEVHVRLIGIQPEALIAHLVEQKIGVRSARSTATNLENIFLTLTGANQ
ncbi:MAG: ABC transporter ATP-binding protein [Myxococcota bacterium]|nr:ABC transporter ATP-binding protein [Myxococcota bacterium]